MGLLLLLPPPLSQPLPPLRAWPQASCDNADALKREKRGVLLLMWHSSAGWGVACRVRSGVCWLRLSTTGAACAGGRWRRTAAHGWQRGCLLEWRPGRRWKRRRRGLSDSTGVHMSDGGVEHARHCGLLLKAGWETWRL
eukprot:6194432-Pleurochrysis_carterae.AAC.1